MGLGLGLGLNRSNVVKQLHNVINSTVLDLDATLSQSYAGSGQVWANLTPSPATGDSQTAYDMHFGADNTATTDDPSFTGTAGSKSAYMSFDGGDYFTLKSGTNTDFINNIHKTTGGSDFWIAVCGRVGGEDAGQVLVGNQDTSGSVGLSANFSSTNKFRLQQRGGTAEEQVDSLDTYSTGFDFFAVYSHDHATNTTRIWVNGVLTELSHTFNTTTSDASSTLHIGGHGSGAAAFVANGTRVYSVAMGNSFLTSAQERAMRQFYQSRHARSYTDSDVDVFDFADSADQEQSTLITSDIVQVKGFAGPETVSVSGDGSPAYRICEDDSCSVVLTDWTSDNTTVTYGSNKIYAQLRLTSAGDFSTTRTATLTFGDEVVDWGVTTAADSVTWTADISTASYGSDNVDISAQVSVPAALAFNPTGTIMYANSSNVIYQYTLSTAWDVTSASYASKSFTASETSNIGDIFIGDSGTKIYVASLANDTIEQYTLSTPYDISTASYASKSLDISVEEINVRGLWINEDGDKVFITGSSSDDISSYDLSTPWDMSTGTHVADFDVSGQASAPQGIHLNPQGTKAYVVDSGSDTVYEYDMSTAFDLSTASYSTKSFSVTTEAATPLNIRFRDDTGAAFYVPDNGGVIYQYSVTAS